MSTGLAVHGRSVWVINAMSTRDGPVLGTGLLHSADGGSHFALQPEAIPGIACTYSPASDTVVWSYCSGGHFMYAYLSADAGARFAAAARIQPPPATPDSYPSGSMLEVASPTTAVAASDLPGNPLIRTTRPGHHMERRPGATRQHRHLVADRLHHLRGVFVQTLGVAGTPTGSPAWTANRSTTRPRGAWTGSGSTSAASDRWLPATSPP